MKILLVTGYAKKRHIHALRATYGSLFKICCVYEREPATDIKKEYLKLFEEIFDLTQKTEQQRLRRLKRSILISTCTQERDMTTHIKVLHLLGEITDKQKTLYETLIDKGSFKAHVNDISPELVPRHHIIDIHAQDIHPPYAYPFVLKPSGFAGSSLVSIIRTKKEFQKYIDTYRNELSHRNEFHNRNIQLVAEQYISGPQYSLNVYINKKGDITFCPATRVIPAFEIGISDTYSVFQYVTSELTQNETQKMYEVVHQIVKMFHIRNTSAHFDMVQSDSGWKCFEVGLRIGGSRRSFFYHSHNFDHLINDIKNKLGETITIPPQSHAVCIVQKGSSKTGILKKISHERTVTENKVPLVIESKFKKLGEYVKPISDGGGTITRHFVVGNSESEVLDTARTLFDQIQFKISRKRIRN